MFKTNTLQVAMELILCPVYGETPGSNVANG